MFFDTHCHLDEECFDSDREKILNTMQTQGFMPCVLVGADMPSSRRVRSLAQTRPWLYYAAAVHPHDAKSYTEADHQELKSMMSESKCVAWGEIGLDYFYDLSPRETQKEVFVRQLEEAERLHKPVILHIRDAHGDITELLRARRGHLPEGIIHCCSASAEQAKVYLEMGFYISFAGPVTFKKSIHLQETARMVPEDRLLIETDSPYLSPEPLRGQRNDPTHVAHIAQKLAELRGVTVEHLAEVTRLNGMRLFGIEE